MSFTISSSHPMSFAGFRSGRSRRTAPAVGAGSSDRALRAAIARERRAARRDRGITHEVADATRDLALLRIGLPH